MTTEVNLARASEEETQALRKMVQSFARMEDQTDPTVKTSDELPRRTVRRPDFMCPDGKQKQEAAALRRLADQPLTSGRTIDLIPQARRRKKSCWSGRAAET